MTRLLIALTLVSVASFGSIQRGESSITPIVRTVDLDVGQTATLELEGGEPVTVELLDLDEQAGDVWGQIYRATATVRINGEEAVLISGVYRLPITVGGVQVDCPVTGGLRANSHIDHWALEKDARLRVWPKDSPWIRPDTFVYPAGQNWFASRTSMANEPVSPRPNRQLYYHAGLDVGGAEGMVDVLAATDALVVSLGTEVLPGHEKDTPVEPRYDVIYLLDARGWYYRYSHLQSLDPAIRLGQRVTQGQKIGTLGKEGGSGGWSHLHFEIKSRQPSGRWGTQEGYAFIWEAFLRQYRPPLLAVARPGHVVFAGQRVVLDGTLSWSDPDGIVSYDWTLSDGTAANGSRVERTYDTPGTYVETLKVTDSQGRIDYDFAPVKVFDRAAPDRQPPRLHAAYAPTFNIKPGDPVTFKVRAFHTTHGEEVWNFGDGSPPVAVKSDGNVKQLAKDGYAVTVHRYRRPGDYLVHVRRYDENGHQAEDRLHVRVEE